MPGIDEPKEYWYPEEVRIITDLETLQTVADPLRLRILAILRRELDEAMLLCGCTTLADIDGSLLKPA